MKTLHAICAITLLLGFSVLIFAYVGARALFDGASRLVGWLMLRVVDIETARRARPRRMLPARAITR